MKQPDRFERIAIHTASDGYSAEAWVVSVPEVMQLLRNEVARWKAAHDEMVSRNRLLRDRLDLPADRIRAHDEWVRKLEEKEREIQQIREHEFQRGYRDGEAVMLVKAVRFAKHCIRMIPYNRAEYVEAITFLKEHP